MRLRRPRGDPIAKRPTGCGHGGAATIGDPHQSRIRAKAHVEYLEDFRPDRSSTGSFRAETLDELLALEDAAALH
jgi:hypothetical protein